MNDQVRNELKRIYRNRLQAINIRNGLDLQDLLKKDYRLFSFQLFYFYLTDRDISAIVERIANEVLIAISYFVRACNDKDITNYFSNYIHITEYEEQIVKIYKEQNIIKAKLDFLEKSDFKQVVDNHNID